MVAQVGPRGRIRPVWRTASAARCRSTSRRLELWRRLSRKTCRSRQPRVASPVYGRGRRSTEGEVRGSARAAGAPVSRVTVELVVSGREEN